MGCEKYNEFHFPQRELRQEAGRGGDLKPDIKAGKLLSRQMWERWGQWEGCQARLWCPG